MSRVLKAITGAMDNLVTSFETVEAVSQESFDPSNLNEVRQGIGLASAQLDEMEEKYRKIAEQQERNRESQDEYNRKIKEGVSLADGLLGKVKGMVGAYLGMQTVKKVVDISDELVTNRARIETMNDKLQTTDELMNSIFSSAQRARGLYSDMVNVVAKFGNNVGIGEGKVFKTSKEVVRFSELVQKQMKLAGASATESSNAMLQLSQALGSGVLRGDELNSIFEQAPNLIRTIADYMGIGIGEIRQMASEGKITADIVKNAMFSAADDIEKAFDNVPMTWGDVFTQGKNLIIKALDPVLNEINAIANMNEMKSVINGVTTGVVTIGRVLAGVFNFTSKIFSFVVKNWSVIAPILWGIVGALIVYNAQSGIAWFETMKNVAAKAAHAVASAAETAAIIATIVAQDGLNAALKACPITWIIALLIVLIAVIVGVCNHIAKVSDNANTAFGVLVGWIWVAGAMFKNLGLLIVNIWLGIVEATKALCANMSTAFHNAISGIKSWFYGLLSTALKVISGICEALNKLPFVKFDFSGVSNMAADYAAKSAAESSSKNSDYKSVSAAFKEGFNTFDVFQKGWAMDAFKNGAAKGDALVDKIKDKFGFSSTDGLTNDFTDDYLSNIEDFAGSTADNSGKAADGAGRAADALSKTNEELEWLRDIAEREAINRFTTAEVKIDMTGMTNQISNDMDLDGVISALTEGFVSSLSTAAEGVY